MLNSTVRTEFNHLNQPVGELLSGWREPAAPARKTIHGTCCRLEPLDPALHARSLFAANALDESGASWTYLPYGPFDDFKSYSAWLDQIHSSCDPLFYAIVERSQNDAVGVASYLRITPAAGTIEIGHLHFSPRLQHTLAATEALHLMIAHAFALGYRRLEWKCDALNAPSRSAALRLGFTFEGIFRQASVVKGRNRDTAWYAIIDKEWPALDAAFRQWLAPSNFDSEGRQRTRLSALTASVVRAHATLGD